MSKPVSSDELAAFDYELPERLIARQPPARRDGARMLLVDRDSGKIASRLITDLPELLAADDCLVLNDTRVLPARLFGRRIATDGHWEGLFLGSDPAGRWRLIGKTRGKLQPGERIALTPAHPESEAFPPCELSLIEQESSGTWVATPQPPEAVQTILDRYGTMPLPPYIRRPIATAEDRQRYQTVYAEHAGAVAAPTAGLHLSHQLLQECRDRPLGIEKLTLHVGLDTFRPINVGNLDEHQMHSEWCRLASEVADKLNAVRHAGGRIVAVGTTVVRTLESAADGSRLTSFDGSTDLFIRPGHHFAAVDALLTNFHLPRSTLFVLVCAFCGQDLAREAYHHAIADCYRFYSYGDAMLIL